jgi:2',3'-cyclic-nucleotide 2'-phosphodiesterase (5'-nucleotidase family)
MLRPRKLAPGLLVALALACTSAPAPPSRTAPASAAFTILQINDTYKIEGLEAGRVGGMARVRALRHQMESERRPVLVLHGGDFLFPSVMSRHLQGEPMVATLNRLDGSDDFDQRLFVTFGNHEFDSPDRDLLLARLGQSRFAWLSANVKYRRAEGEPFVDLAGQAPNVAASKTLEVGGVRVGLFGLTMPAEPRDWVDYGDFERLVASARRAVDELRGGGAEFVIALTHQEMGDDVRLAEQVPGIDWIVGGHEHVALERRVRDTWITKADADARTAVRIDVARGARGLEGRHRLVELAGEIAPDPTLLGEVARWLVRLEERVRAKTGRRLLEVVATTEHALEGVEPAIRGRETALGNFLADVLRERLATDLAFVNGGSIRVNDDVPAGGDVRVYELEGIFYYDNAPVAFELTGGELVALLAKSVSQATLAHGRFLQVSGLRFRYHAAPAPDGGESTRVDASEVEVRPAGRTDWEPVDPARRYSVASLDWLWANGCRDGYPRFGQGCGGESPRRLDRPVLSFRAITEEAIGRLPGRRIRTAIDGRIVRLAEGGGGDEGR